MFCVALLILSSFALVRGESCESTTYDPEKYICYEPNGNLCPIINGSPYSYCDQGAYACFDTHQYSCSSTQLEPLEPQTESFELIVSNPNIKELHGLPVHAANYQLRTGPNARTSTYCPEGTIFACDKRVTNRTVLRAGGGRFGPVSVLPGGQHGFLYPSSLYPSYTRPHSGYIPKGAQVDGIYAYKGGAFVNSYQPEGWWACPPGSNVDEADGVWNIYGAEQNVTGCVGVDLLVKQVEPELEWFAWEYI
ncbi:hypothetical protein K504DRAFT_453247 [Pleomassaria siparia CBS 279.74]|uniref:Endo-1,3(4)-beta-glucanase 1 carbohydrate binding domain-containing protein n=1 Tax=Pleomassaria siparia CBS 279.74 TaxID=1314801 RepID=A0A6G1KFZ8_9PLEO|nr:hypothetical protein K504DRAFT_453247 [Pleomassaria siparia CBS 279.74]